MNWDAKYIPNFRIIRLMVTRQIEVFDLTGRLRKVNICDVQKISPSEFIVNCIPYEQVFAIKEKYKNELCILKEVMLIDAFYKMISLMLYSDVNTLLNEPPFLYCKYVHSVCIAIATIGICMNIELYRKLLVLLFSKINGLAYLHQTPLVVQIIHE